MASALTPVQAVSQLHNKHEKIREKSIHNQEVVFTVPNPWTNSRRGHSSYMP